MKTIVFDFDKTLTYNDTLHQLLLWRMCMTRRYYFLPIYCFLIVLVKMKIISLKRLKEICINILFPKKIDDITKISKCFISKIRLSEIYEKLIMEMSRGNRVVVLSASPTFYLKQLFPNIEIIGTNWYIDKNGNIGKICEHPYGEEKLISLRKRGILKIDSLYYDSKSDEVLLPICQSAHMVRDGKVVKTINL